MGSGAASAGGNVTLGKEDNSDTITINGDNIKLNSKTLELSGEISLLGTR